MERARGLGIVMTLAMTAGCGAPAAPAGSSTTPVPLAAPAVGVVAPAPVPRIPETIGGFALPASTRTEPLPDDLLFAIASVDRGMQAWRVGRLAAGARLDDAALAQTQLVTHHQLGAARDPSWQAGRDVAVDGGLFVDGAPSGGGRGGTVPGLRHLQAEVSPLQATDLVLLVAATERFDDLAAIAQADPTGGIFALAVDDGAGGTTAWAVRFASGAAPTTDVVPEVGPDDVLVSGHVIVPIAGATIDAPADAGDLELVIGAAVPVAGVMLVADQLIAAGVTRFDICLLYTSPSPRD